MSTAAPHKAAIQRWSLSRPVSLAFEDGLLSTETNFDYGCRRGDDPKRRHHPARRRCARLTGHEERLGLLDDAAQTSTRSEWLTTFRRPGVTISGHQLFTLPTH